MVGGPLNDTYHRRMASLAHDSGLQKPLSARETEVLTMASTGLRNAEIADRLCISIHAVKFHLATIYRKLGVTNRTEAAVVFLRSAGEHGAEG